MAENNNSMASKTSEDYKEEVAWVDKEIKTLSKKYQQATLHYSICSNGTEQTKDMELPTQLERETLRSEVEDVHRELQSQATAAPVQKRQPPQHYCGKELSLEEQLEHTNRLLEQVIQERMVAENERTVDRTRLREIETQIKEELRLSHLQEKQLQRHRTHMKNVNMSTTGLPPELLDESIYNGKTKEELIKDLRALHTLYAAKTDQLQAERLQADFHKKELEEVRLQFHEKESEDLKVADNLRAEKAARQMEVEGITHLLEFTNQNRDKRVEAIMTQLQEETSSGLLLASKLEAQEEANQQLRRQMGLLKRQIKMDERSEGAFCPNETAGVDAPEKVQQTAEEVQETAEKVLETADKYQETAEKVLETADEHQETVEKVLEIAGNMEVVCLNETAGVDAPEKVQQTAEKVQETAEKVLEFAGNTEETPEQPSLWRQFKKFLTPKHRRKYKQQQKGDQDQK